MVGVIPTSPEEEEVIGLLRQNRVDLGVVAEGIITGAATGAARGADGRAANGRGRQSNVLPATKIIRRRKQATGMIRIMGEGHGTAKLRGASGTIAWRRGATNTTLRTETIVTDPVRRGQLIARGVTLARQTGGANEPIILRRRREAAVGGDPDRHVVAIQTPLLLVIKEAAVGNVTWTTGKKGIN